jgi:hypothetical protein
MEITVNMAPKVHLKLQPIPRNVLRTALAGEYLRNLGIPDDEQIQKVQQDVNDGRVRKITVIGRDGLGVVRDLFHLKLGEVMVNDTVMLDLSDGKSFLEALDTGLAAAVAAAIDLMKRKGLKPEFHIDFSAEVRAEPNGLAQALRRLNDRSEPAHLRPNSTLYLPPMPEPVLPPPPPAPQRPYTYPIRSYDAPPPLPAGYVYKPVLTVTPAKDPGVSFIHETTRRIP